MALCRECWHTNSVEGHTVAVDKILVASTIITMDPKQPTAEAVAIDSTTGLIAAVGNKAELIAANPNATVNDLGTDALLPGFIDAHNHPVLSGITTMEPSHWIAPYVGFPDVKSITDLFTKLDESEPAGQALMFSGLDRSLQGTNGFTADELDKYFPSRPVAIIDNSGHAVYFNTAVMQLLGWANNTPPADPVGASFGRNADGTSNGVALEAAALMVVALPVMARAVPHPLRSGALWYQLMAKNGVTATSEHTYQANQMQAMVALASVPDSPLRVAVYHMSTEPDCGDPIQFPVPEAMLKKNGIKLWADGSPWLGTIASTLSYLDNDTTRAAGITPGLHGEEMMNYTRAQIDAVIDANASKGWQFAFHCNGDMAFDIVLDAYEYGLNKYGLIGTDHRWRVEHVGAGRGDQFKRAASLGVAISMSPFQYIYWGDLLDGTLFDSEIGAEWQRFADAFDSGAVVSFHNDGSVSPPIPLLNIKTAVTRQAKSGNVHGANQAISLDDALKASTINAALHLKRDHEIGSIEAGKFADFVQLAADPYAVDPAMIDQIAVNATWLAGKRINLDAFISQIEAIDPSEHQDLHAAAVTKPHAC